MSEEAEESLLDKLLKEKAQLKNKDLTKWNQFEKSPPSEKSEDLVWYWDDFQGLMLIKEHQAYRRGSHSLMHNPHWLPR